LLARKYNLCVIEDCAQAHGATYKGKKVGGIGDIGCFSFYANKIITTGEGGMVTTNNSDLADRARSLKSLAFGKSNKFMHTDVGYNYRMTNLQAAIGCAQLGKIENIISSKRKIAAFYANAFSSLDTLQLPLEKTYARHVYWMYHINLLGPAATKREYIMKKLQELGIETREGFVPYNMQEIFINRGWVNLEDCPKANRVALSSFYLPSGPLLTEEELEYVVIRLKLILCF
jgi:perosamine synthetase